MRSGGLETGDHVVQEIQVPIDVLRLYIDVAEAHVRHQICDGVPYAADLLSRVYLLDYPSRVLLPECVCIDPSEHDYVEMRREFPEISYIRFP